MFSYQIYILQFGHVYILCMIQKDQAIDHSYGIPMFLASIYRASSVKRRKYKLRYLIVQLSDTCSMQFLINITHYVEEDAIDCASFYVKKIEVYCTSFKKQKQ